GTCHAHPCSGPDRAPAVGGVGARVLTAGCGHGGARRVDGWLRAWRPRGLRAPAGVTTRHPAGLRGAEAAPKSCICVQVVAFLAGLLAEIVHMRSGGGFFAGLRAKTAHMQSWGDGADVADDAASSAATRSGAHLAVGEGESLVDAVQAE